MTFTMRGTIALALLAMACGGGAPEVTQDNLGVAHCRPDARCGRTGPEQYCADLTSDEANCGVCGNVCRAGEVCLGGACLIPCADGLAACTDEVRSYCADVTSDEENCGGCGIACTADEYCDSGDCMPACEAGLKNCGVPDAPACVNLQTDADNCGACGRACPVQHACVEGACTLICQADETRCEDAQGVPYCTNTLDDPLNCGGCGPAFACADGRACTDGVCVAPCADGLTSCNGGCADTTTDEANCGACGNACATGYSCAGGSCRLDCASNLTHCGEGDGQSCEDTTTDTQNCGGCGIVCAPGQSCRMGNCVCDSGTTCGGACVDKTSDENNCGDCGVVCGGFTPVCAEGVCEADPTATSYPPAVAIPDALGRDYASITSRGGASPGYWASTGWTNTVNVASYDATSFAATGTWSTARAYRSIFTAGGSGEKIYIRYSASQYVLEMLSPGVFTAAASLNGGPVGAIATDASVSLTVDDKYFVTHNSGVVSLWNKVGGAWVKSITLQGWGTDPQVPSETSPAARYRAAVARDKILTYAGGVLSIWTVDASGTTAQRRKVTLVGVDTSYAMNAFSLSYANDYVFIHDYMNGVWRGYRVGGL